MANFDLTNLAVKTICPNNVVKIDETELPSVIVYIPAFKNSDVLTGGNDSIHPAFIVNGVQIPGFYYSKYQNCEYKGVAYSLPAEDPRVNVTFNTARAYCEAKGNGRMGRDRSLVYEERVPAIRKQQLRQRHEGIKLQGDPYLR